MGIISALKYGTPLNYRDKGTKKEDKLTKFSLFSGDYVVITWHYVIIKPRNVYKGVQNLMFHDIRFLVSVSIFVKKLLILENNKVSKNKLYE